MKFRLTADYLGNYYIIPAHLADQWVEVWEGEEDPVIPEWANPVDMLESVVFSNWYIE